MWKKPDNKPVYSTDKNFLAEANKRLEPKPSPGKGGPKMRLETKGRGGKAVTVIFNLGMTEEAAEKLMKSMKTAFGCGATFKNDSIELQGDMRSRVEAFFTKIGQAIVRAGG